MSLGSGRWVAGDPPMLADDTLYPYTRWAGGAEVDLQPYPAVTRWLETVEPLPAFLPPRPDGAIGATTFDAYFNPRG